MATLANQSTFRFQGNVYTVTSVAIEAPQPEIVNMTAYNDGVQIMRMVKTGAFTSPGKISVEGFGLYDPKNLVGQFGQVSFVTPVGSVARFCILDSASTDAKVSDVLRVSMTFMPTDEQNQ
jgi:hypothetical protein